MNRRRFLSMIGLAPVAAVAAARSAVAEPRMVSGDMASGFTSRIAIVGEAPGESLLPPAQFRKFTIRPSDLTWLESRRYTVSEIADFYEEYAEAAE
jgi:hypothetical protein